MAHLPELITKARARLLVRAPFLGSIALGLAWVDAPDIGTMATDGRSIWFNLAWCEAQGIEKTMGVIAHEVLHVVNKHHLRRGERQPKLWNIAADLLINRLLTDDKYVLPDKLLFDHDRRYAGLPTETIYARLLEAQPAQQQSEGDAAEQPGSGGQHPPSGTSQPTMPEQRKRQGASSKTSVGHNEPGREGRIAPAEDWGEVRDLTTETGKPLSPSERCRADHDIDVRIRQAAAGAKRAGKLSSALGELVEVATNRVDWRDHLRMVFDGTLRGDISWVRPNRRFIQHGLYLPGWRRTGAGRVAFVLDTSGSISAAELALYTAGVLGILEETGPEEIALIQCDADVRRVDYLQPGDSFDRIEVIGRGGTRFQPALDWISESGFAPNVVVYATDLVCSDQPRDPGPPVIWLTPTRGRTVPFGEIVEVSA